MIDLEALLLRGPLLSTDASLLFQSKGVTVGAARQRIARANGAVRRLDGLVFPRGARLLYHETTYNSPLYWKAIVRDIGKASPAYAAAVDALRARGGVVTEKQFHIVCGSPVAQKGQLASAAVLERFLAI